MKIYYVAYQINTTGNCASVFTMIDQIAAAAGQPPTQTAFQYFKRLADHLCGIASYAIDHLAAVTDDDTLIVIAAPEFYFKSYMGAPFDNQTMTNGLQHLKDNMPAPQKGSLMILPGTIWWGFPVTGASQIRMFNTLPVFIDGKLVHTWQKQALSSVDGLVNGAQVWDNQNINSAGRVDGYLQTQDPTFQITVNGNPYRVGLEVCLDHNYCLQTQTPNVGLLRCLGTPPVDLHLVISCGMHIYPANVVARKGGAVFLCDGAGYGTAFQLVESVSPAGPQLSDSQGSATYKSWSGGNATNPNDLVRLYDFIEI